ncbi:hypothetical protein TNCV_2354201 [Trichonephila clavipes]|nr:hypothetical protein TNCV_2354201 [Trichonephila clavipes]
MQEIKTSKRISYLEARKLIVPQLTQTYVQATKPSNISTTTQTDPSITNIFCPPLQCLKPKSSTNQMTNTSKISVVSTSSSFTQANLLPSTSAVTLDKSSKSQLPIPISTNKGCFFERTATAGSDVVQSGRPIFDDFFQHLWPYIGNNTANVVFKMVKRLWLIRIDQ